MRFPKRCPFFSATRPRHSRAPPLPPGRTLRPPAEPRADGSAARRPSSLATVSSPSETTAEPLVLISRPADKNPRRTDRLYPPTPATLRWKEPRWLGVNRSGAPTFSRLLTSARLVLARLPPGDRRSPSGSRREKTRSFSPAPRSARPPEQRSPHAGRTACLRRAAVGAARRAGTAAAAVELTGGGGPVSEPPCFVLGVFSVVNQPRVVNRDATSCLSQ